MTMAPLGFLLNKRFEHQILALMLAGLHLALWWDFGSALSRSLILAHLGLFLMWQPLWRREQRLNWKGSIVFSDCTSMIAGIQAIRISETRKVRAIR